MRTAIILSAVLHVALFLVAVIGLPRPEDRLVMMPEAIPVEVVDIGLLTNTKVEKPEAKPKPAPKPEPPKPTPPKTQPPPPPERAKAEPLPPPPLKQPEPPKQVAEAKPEPKKEVPKPEPKKEAPKPEPKKEPPPKKEEPKPEPKKPDPPKKEEPKRDFTSVLKNLEKLKEEPPPAPTKEPETPTQTAEAPQSLDASKSDRLTISEEDAVRRAVSACWFVDAGARDVHNQRVEIRVWMNPDRTVRDARVERSTADRATTERALRAVQNPRCQPLPLPPDQYDRWKVIVFNFDPRDML